MWWLPVVVQVVRNMVVVVALVDTDAMFPVKTLVGVLLLRLP
jgi:hypothetical protein